MPVTQTLNWTHLNASKRRRDREWARYDEILYAMCREYPRHADVASVNAKVGIIARAYATGIERKIRSKRTQGSSMSQLSEFIAVRGDVIDAVLAPLRRLAAPLTAKKLERIVDAHGKLVRLLKPLLVNRQASRSFWSKYMHFHCSVVPVYDSYVARALPSLVRWNDALATFEPPESADLAYCWYSMRFLSLYERVRQRRPEFTVKELDFFLLGL